MARDGVQDSTQIAMRVSWGNLIRNAILSVLKLIIGIFARSAALVSDAVNDVADVVSGTLLIVGLKMSGKSSDREHPYGHERFECVSALLLAMVLFATGAGIGWAGVERIAAGSRGELAVPGVLALVAAGVSVAVKEGMYWYTRSAAKKIDSAALMADAWHHRSDALASAGGFLGILGARLGLPVLDPAACVLISLLIIKVAVDICRDAVGKMTDRACDEATAEAIRCLVLEQAAVMRVDLLNTRLFGNRIYVDVEVGADGNMTLREAHEAAQRVHDAVERGFPKVKHCMVHVNPAEDEETGAT